MPKPRVPKPINYFTPKRLFCYAVAAAFMLVAVLLGAAIFRNMQEWLSLRNATVVDAQILGYSQEGSGRHRYTKFTYAYSFSGRMYQRSTGDLGPFASNRAEERRLIAAAKHGLMVPCYVDPSNPSKAFLSRRPSPLNITGVFILFAGFAFAATSILRGCLSKRYAHQFE